MSEPLKGRHKVYMQDYIESGIFQGVELDDIIFKKEDIKSAVDWLKRRLNYLEMNNEVLFDEINEAFEDVTLGEECALSKEGK